MPAGVDHLLKQDRHEKGNQQLITLDELIGTRPLIHGGQTITYGIDKGLAEFLDRYLQPSHTTLETGCGLSTLVILRAGVQQHIAITPEPDQFEVIREFCGQSGLDLERLLPIARCSQEYLPTATLPRLDLVLIDGDHSFPIPFIDWYYTANDLRVGGVMVVDDTHIVTGKILADFMAADPRWAEVFQIPGRCAVFRKMCHPVHDGIWRSQPYLERVYPTRSITIARSKPRSRLGRMVWSTLKRARDLLK